MASTQPRKIDLTQLQPQQILEIRKSTEQEISHFTLSLQALQTAQSKLRECVESIDKLVGVKTETEKDTETETEEGVEASKNEAKVMENDVLVPMTSSLYLPGKLVDKDLYLVDIGTGYFVEKRAEEAKRVYVKKIDKLNEDSRKLKDILVQKNEILNSVNLVLRKKMMEYERERQIEQQSN